MDSSGIDIQTSPIPKRLSDSQEVNLFLSKLERFEKDTKNEIIKEYASEALSRFHVKSGQSEECRNLVASQGSRPFTIKFTLSSTKERNPHPNNQPVQNVHKTIPYRQLNSKLIRVSTRNLNSYVVKLKNKRKSLLEELSEIRDEAMSSFPVRPDPARQKCHYDYLLEESVLVANDFIEERKWKIQVAYILAHEAQAFYYEHIHNKRHPSALKQSPEEAASDRLVEQHKQIGHFLSSIVNEFWNNVKEAQTEVFDSKPRSSNADQSSKSMIQLNSNASLSPEDVRSLYQAKPKSLDGYLDYCYRNQLTSLVACSSTNPAWESVLFAVVRQIRFFQMHSSLIFLPEEWKEFINLVLDTQFPLGHSGVSVYSTIPETPLSPSLAILFSSCLSSHTQGLPFDLSHTHVIVIQDSTKLPATSAVTQQLFQHSQLGVEHMDEAVFSVSASSSTQRTTRQKDMDEGGSVHLPVELCTMPLAPWQADLRDVLLDAIEEKLEDVPSATDVLQSMFLLYHQTELGAENWSPMRTCALPGVEVTWPVWLWSVLVPSPYYSVLNSTYDIRFYSPLSLRKKEMALLLDITLSHPFNHGCDMYEPRVALKKDLILSDALFDQLRITPKVPSSLLITETPVVVDSPFFNGSDRGYKWITHGLNRFSAEACKYLTSSVSETSEVSHHAEPTIVSPRIKNVLLLLSEGRKEKKKQLIICDSEAMAYSITRHCYKAGYRVIELTGNPMNSSADVFWNAPAVLQFNNTPASTLGLICLRRFNQPKPSSSPLIVTPMVDMIYMVEKPKPNYWQQLNNNILFMLSTRRNANAHVMEVFSELEMRVTFSVTGEDTREEKTTAALRTLFNLSLVKEKKETRPALFEIFNEAEWLGFEEYYNSNHFLWKENEKFPAVKKEVKLITDLDCIDPSVLKNEKKLQIQSLLSDMPILSYCFAIANQYGIETSTLSAVEQPMDLDSLLNPCTITKQFEFPCYPVPPKSTNVVPFVQKPRWNSISELGAQLGTVDLLQQPNQMDGLSTLAPFTNYDSEGLSEYTPVERSLLAWESAVMDYHNQHPETEVDSVLYSTLSYAKNKSTNISEHHSMDSFFCISVSVNKSSDMGENGKNKRNRKRLRDGPDQEEKQPSGSIGNYIYHSISRPYVWSQVEDELLCALVMQFGTGWSFICSVLLMEKINQITRTRKDCTNRWEYLTKNKIILNANLPVETRYLCIPERPLSTVSNPLFYYSYNVPREEEPKPKQEAPFASLFKKVQRKEVRSSLHSLLPASNVVKTKLKERDQLFANEEGDVMKHLHFYLRPIQTGPLTRDPLRRPASVRPMTGTSPVHNDQVKPQSNRVQIIPYKIPFPPNYLELRRESINNLPTARISITDTNLFKFLLEKDRTPQQGIVVPFKDAMEKAHRIQEGKRGSTMELGGESASKSEGELLPSAQYNNGIVFDSIMNLEELQSMNKAEIVDLESVKEETVKEEAIHMAPTRVHSSFNSSVVELQSVSVKREREETPETTVIDLKLQKLPISTVKRLKKIEPTSKPHAFYTPASHLSRSNLRFLQHNLTIKKQVLRNPASLIQSITNPNARKDPTMTPQQAHTGRDMQETMVYDRHRQQMNRAPQSIQYTNNAHVTQQRGVMRSANPQQHPSGQTVFL